MSQLAIWPFAVPMDSTGAMIDGFQGVYSRGLCRALAEGLLRASSCEVAVCLPVVTIGSVTSWSVTGKEWTLQESLSVPLPEGTDLFAWGSACVTRRIDLHLCLVSQSQRRLIVDTQFACARADVLLCLSEVVNVLANAISGRPLNVEEEANVHRWGTRNAEAYLAYLEAWAGSTARRLGIIAPNPDAALECAFKAMKLDPSFSAARTLGDELILQKSGAHDSTSSNPIGYSEYSYLIGTI